MEIFKIFSKNVSLGHRRLSIIDLSDDGNQPMSTKSNIWHIVFNGEIYNFEEIKSELDYIISFLRQTLRLYWHLLKLKE